MYLPLTENQKQTIEEIAALSGIQKGVIREVYEFTFVRWAEKIAEGGMAQLEIPFLGTLGVRYAGDNIEDSGEVTTKVDAFISLAPSFKKLVGDIHDEGSSVVVDLLQKKLENALLTLASDNH